MWPMTMIMNQPKAMLECMKPSTRLRFHSFTWIRQSQKMSRMFFQMVVGVMSEMANLRRSAAGSWMRTLIRLTRQYSSTKVMPKTNGRTNGS